MSADDDFQVCELVNRLIPIVKKRILRASERSREDVELEISTLANLLTIQERMRCTDC